MKPPTNKTLLLLFILAFFSVNIAGAQPIDKNVKSFTIYGLRLFKMDSKKWAVADSVQLKPTDYLSELYQDDSSIYFLYQQGVADIKLNLFTKTATISENYKTKKFSVDVKVNSWSEKTITNGWTVNQVQTDNGSFYKTTGNRWAEADVNGKEISFFTEKKRDSVSLILLKDDGNQLKLDLQQKISLFLNSQTNEITELYKLTGWDNSVRTTGFTINSVAVGVNALFKTNGRNWVLLDSAGNLRKTYLEEKRNDTSVVLKEQDTLLVINTKHKDFYMEIANWQNKRVRFPLTDWSNEIPDNAFTIQQVHCGKIVFYPRPGEWVRNIDKYEWASNRWAETDSLKKPFGNFKELSRNIHSILLKKDDGLLLRISTRDSMVYMQPANQAEQPLYTISKMSRENFVSGWTVNRVTFQGGMLYETGSSKEWTETNAEGKEISRFTETNRDEWSVYLRKSDGSLLQIDLYVKTTFFTPVGGKQFELYKLTGW